MCNFYWWLLLDIDECAVNKGGCSYKCVNQIGSFYCECPVGSVLMTDGFTCKGTDHTILYLLSL